MQIRISDKVVPFDWDLLLKVLVSDIQRDPSSSVYLKEMVYVVTPPTYVRKHMRAIVKNRNIDDLTTMISILFSREKEINIIIDQYNHAHDNNAKKCPHANWTKWIDYAIALSLLTIWKESMEGIGDVG